MKIILKIFFIIIESINKTLFSFKWLLLQIKNENFKNHFSNITVGANQSIAILGNGPSLNKDIEKLNKKDIDNYIAVNDFISSTLFNTVKPKYYILADPAYFDPNINNKNIEETLSLLCEIDYELFLFIPFTYFKIFSKNNPISISNKNLIVIPFHTNEYKGFECVRFYLYKAGLSMPKVQNVIIPAIFNSINMGYKSVYLLGVDHSWITDLRVDKNNNVCTIVRRFYDNNPDNTLTPFLKITKEPYKMHEILTDLSYTFKGYHILEKYSKTQKCKIYNLTIDSFIDAFEKKI